VNCRGNSFWYLSRSQCLHRISDPKHPDLAHFLMFIVILTFSKTHLSSDSYGVILKLVLKISILQIAYYAMWQWLRIDMRRLFAITRLVFLGEMNDKKCFGDKFIRPLELRYSINGYQWSLFGTYNQFNGDKPGEVTIKVTQWYYLLIGVTNSALHTLVSAMQK